MMQKFLLRPLSVWLLAAAALVPNLMPAQTPVALPYTMTTIAGGLVSASAYGNGNACPGSSATMTDGYGDGCPAVSAKFGASGRGGVAVDAFGNVFVADDINNTIHMIDASTGILSVVAGNKGSACTGAYDTWGDNCLAAKYTSFNGPRGIGVDPYGNVLIAGYNDALIHIVCRTASPLCSAAQIGYMEPVAGCITSTGSSSTATAGKGTDNAAGLILGSTCGTNPTIAAEVDLARGVAADVYGNVYFADTASYRYRVILGPKTSTYFSGNNPLYAALQTAYSLSSLPTQGYAYTLAGLTTTATTKNSSCGGLALDTIGDGCLPSNTSVVNSTGVVTGVAVDAAGNMVFTDSTNGLRVFFANASGTAGTLMSAAIQKAEGMSSAPTPGYVYRLAGGGTNTAGPTPALGNTVQFPDGNANKLTVSPQGNIYVADSGNVFFYDISNATMRLLLKSGTAPSLNAQCGSTGAYARSAYGDGCPVTGSTSYAAFGGGSAGLGIAVDGQGNLYMYDSVGLSSGMLVRKVLAQGTGTASVGTLNALASTSSSAYPWQALGTTQTQSYMLHFPSATGSSATIANSTNANFTYNLGTCTLNSVDSSLDCPVTVTYKPTAAGSQSASFTLTASGGESTTVNLGGTVAGSVLAVDGASSGGNSIPNTTPLFSGYTPYSTAVDGAGNVYASVSSGSNYSIVESLAGASASLQTLASGLSSKPTSLAVDATGNIYYLNGSSTIQTLTLTTAGAGSAATYAAGTLSYTPASLGTANPVALAVDSAGNLLVADNQSGTDSIYKISRSAVVANTSTVYNVGAFGLVAALTVDPSGNIYVADTTHTSIYKLTPGLLGSALYGYTESTQLSSVSSTGLATDAAGDLYVQAGGAVTMYPLSGPTSTGVTVYSGETSPSGIVVDGVGNLYNADTAVAALTQVQRNTVAENFQSNYSLVFAAQLSNIGNWASSAQSAANGSGAGAYTLSGNSYACPFTNNLLNGIGVGRSCSLTAQFPAIGSSEDYDNIIFSPTAPATSVIGALNLSGLADQKGWKTTTTIGSASSTTPLYAPTGTEVSFPVTVTATALSTDSTTTITTGPTTSNYVLVSVDGGATTTYPLTAASGLSATVTISFSGLTATSHTFKVTFPQQGSFLPSNSSGSFTLGPITPVLTWNPAVSSLPVSSALGTSVLNATVSPAIAGNFAYALGAAPSCTATTTSTTPVDASTYLPLTTSPSTSYTVYSIFCPTDTTDYSVPAAVSTMITITQASTTAAVGATTMLVAPSGGNYTSLTAALQALPMTGGAIYLAPGTYSGQNAISYPNVQLRGLGGDPTQVILTGENGNFSSTSLPTGFTLGPVGKGGDEGSATLDVSKNGYMGQTANSAGATPNNFYAEYLTIQNTYDTDPTTTSTWTATSNGGTCSSGGSATPLQTLYNNNQECGSQALALWVNSDGAVLNNVNLLSQQDTLYASTIGCSGSSCTVARQYMWKGLISGNVDYTFGDAALVFDHTNFFTTWHGLTATGQETITAQNKRYATGSTNGVPNSTIATSSDYLSGFVCNGCTLMSQSTGMTKLYYGRPYDISTSSYPSSYSTWIMLNSNVDQVNAGGWIGWDGALEYLSTSTYGEFNTMAYTDPAVGTYPYPASLYNSTPSVLYTSNSGNATAASLVPTGVNTGSGAALTGRESYALQLNAGTAAPWYPVSFLSTTVPANKLAAGQSANWNPVSALAAQVNNFVPVASVGAVPLGGSVTILGRPQTPGAGVIPTGSYFFYDSLNNSRTCTAVSASCTALASGNLDASGEAYLTTSSLTSGTHFITMVYNGDSNFVGSSSSVYSVYVLNQGQQATLTTLNVANTSSTTGTPLSGTVTLGIAPSTSAAAINASVSIYLDGVATTTCTLASGTCSWSIPGPAAGAHTMYAYYAGSTAYGHSTSSTVSLYVSAPVASGDSRTVTEPTFPAVCTQLTAALTTDVTIQDLDTSVDASVSNIDGARIQAALNSCSATAVASNAQLAVELSMDATATYNAFLSGPLSMPSNVTLLVDPNVTLYFSRNVQDYDKVAGTHTCGTINGNSATGSCRPLIEVLGTSTNVGIMGYGKLNGRGSDLLVNAFATSGYGMPTPATWWTLATQANGEGNQQNPRFIQMDSGSSNITLYKITLQNSPMFHVSTTGSVNGFTAWDIKIVTPTAARNTDGIDPGNVQNGTITRSWISDGDDNVAMGASGSAPAKNISVTNNHFYAGHGESIGSYTGAGVSNILFDSNMSAGNAFAGHGSTVDSNGNFTANGVADTNSTAVRIKTANDRGGLVTGIQYSNSCFLDHKADIQFTPYYSSGDSTTALPSYTGILLQNLVFLNDASSSGTVELTGEYNTNNGNAVTNPLTLTMDNVTFPSALSSLVNSSAPVESSAVWSNGNYSGGTGQYTNLTIGPGNVSSNFLTAFNSLAAVTTNYDTLTNNVSLTTLDAPNCVFTYLAPELTGPNNVAQTLPYNTAANVDVILTPAVGGAAFPTGSVTVTDTATSNTFIGTLSGNGDTVVVAIPASDLTLGAHTFTATYLGDSNYTIPSSYQTFGNYQVTVVQAMPTVAWTPADTSITYGTTLNGLLNATASVAGSFTYTATITGGSPVAVTSNSILAAGSYTLTAAFTPSDATDYASSGTASVALTVNKAAQVISFAQPATPVSYLTPIALSATGGVSGNAVVFSVVSGPAVVSGNLLTITGVGAIVVEADQAASANYLAAAPVQRTIVSTAVALSANAAVLQLGSIAVGTTSQAQTLILTNPNGYPIGDVQVAASGAFTAVGNCATVPALGTCSLNLTFTPTASGAASGTLTVTSASSSTSLTVQLNGTGTAPGIQVTPSLLSFGSQVVSTSSYGQTISILNTGNATLQISSVTTSGDYATLGNCASILAGSTCTLSVVFTPTATGTRVGSVTINETIGNTAQSQVVNLTGVGTQAGAALSPAIQSFGNVLVGAQSSVPLVATLSNTGTASLTGIAASIQGDFTYTTTCAATLAPSASCSFTTTYVPTVSGAESGTLTVTTSLGNQQVSLQGTGLVPGAALSTAQLTFGGQLASTSSAAQTVMLSNTGTGPMTINSVAASNNFADTTNCGATLAAGASCSINITFAPTTTGTLSGTLTVTDTAGTQKVALQGLGITKGLSLTPSSLAFGAQVVGTASQAQTLVLKNTGAVALNLNAITASTAFSESDQCGGSLAAGASCLLSVGFAPSATGVINGTVQVSDSTGTYTTMAVLNGQGTLPGMSVSPASVSFGSISVGSVTLAQIVTLTNTGSAPLTIGQVTVAGDFAESDNCSNQSIPAGANCVIGITMTPTTIGTRTGTIQFSDNVDGVHQIALSGVGQQPGVSISPTSLAFGSYPVVSSAQVASTSGTTLSVTVTNTGNAALQLSSIQTLGDFTESDKCSGTVAAGASCTLSVKFVPTALGHRTGTLTITDDAGGGTQVITLAGDGSPAGLILSPPVLNFGAQSRGSTSKVQTASLTNNTGAAITGLKIVASGELAETDNCGAALVNGSSCTLSITVTPVISGAVTGSISIGSSATVSLVTARVAPMLRALDSALGTTASTSNIAAVAVTATTNTSTATVSSLQFGTAPATTVVAGGNAGSAITVQEVDSNGNLVGATDTLTLTVTGSNYAQSYTAQASGGIATFNLSSAALTKAGSYTYSVAVGANAAISSTSASESVIAAAPASVTVTAGSGQSAAITVAYAAPLVVQVADAYGNAVSGATVNFTAPAAGPSVVLSSSAATTAANGSASVTATANGSAGNFNVTAVSGSSTTASFALSNAKGTPVIAWATPAAINYGVALGATQLAATANVAGAFAYSVPSGAILPAGPQKLTATFTPTDTADYVSGGTANVSLVVNQIAPTVAMTASATSVVLQNAITFNATVSSSVSTPTGSVNFLDGTTVLATVSLSGGAASYNTSSLAVGTHSISIAYLGDTNFKATNSSAVSVSVITITIGTGSSGGSGSGGSGSGSGGSGSSSSGSGTTQVVTPGGTTIISLPIVPTTGTSLPIPLTLSLSGLPPGATASVTPVAWVQQANGISWILPANVALTATTQINIAVPASSATSQAAPDRFLQHAAPIAFALLLLPFAGRIRRSGKRMARMLTVLLLLVAGAAATAGVTGCGSAGYFATVSKTYNVTVAVSAGNLTQSTTVNITVE